MFLASIYVFLSSAHLKRASSLGACFLHEDRLLEAIPSLNVRNNEESVPSSKSMNSLVWKRVQALLSL